ncbi:MAG: valine--tRNA ligase [Lentisphaerae bacterium RIFOXYB12_FULL_65_16]|nr:MAG: valine--tRNA ligase [Lentisphaerae bacterium RIFOXYA12_64_32]OGV92476.1 MAG: valine--tRNA ligase [Lentisphaerae bacterium RIFOXYB12_FULL_65_16]
MTEESMAKAYSPAEVEAKWYPEWERRGYFRARADSAKKPYTIVIPPPNVTGMLTLGHVLNNTLQDILIRFEKMRGREVCWVPGTDHAGIATQSKVEAHLRETEKLTRYDLGREAFLQRVWQWKEQYGGTIIGQLRRLGTACDWERERFTLEPALSKAVEETFIRLYEKGLIYKGHRIINWCPKSRTALSDEEVFYKETNGKLWYFRYPLMDGSSVVTVATTRPETMLGDTAVAVNPRDPRYARLLGKTVRLPLVNREIPIIADEFVDPAFGTGAVKVTPAHDPNDYEIGLRHKLPMINVMNDDGTMNADAGAEFDGLDRYACRKAVLKRMEEQDLIEKIEPHVHQVGYSERGDVPVEPRLSEQWFVRMKPLAEPALAAVLDGRVRFYPDRWVKTYRHWMENIKDWCISRQLWWGHRIPAYYCAGCRHVVVGRSAPASCPKCHTQEFHQEEDVLDTWFSSWLWPFSVFDWPKETPDLKRFYPTDTLVTGPDIIFFWVARMIMAGLEFRGEVPFKDVYFTSIIRDDKGRKMSKSLKNSPDPLDVIATYGADALRFTMVYISPVGQDIRYSNEKCEIGRNFANKLWNSARFRLRQGERHGDWRDLSDLTAADLRPDDQWILARLNETIREVTKALCELRYSDLSRLLYEFMWNDFCDWYLESAKAVLYEGDAKAKAVVLRVFDHVMGVFLRLLHPVMPFVTEELYHHLGFVGEDGSIMCAAWPEPMTDDVQRKLGATPELATRVAAKFELIRQVRNVRASYVIPPATKIAVVIVPGTEDLVRFLASDSVSLQALMYASSVTVTNRYDASGPTGVAVAPMGTAYVPLADIIDIPGEVARLKKQETELRGFLQRTQGKLENEKFVAKAPPDVVEKEKVRMAELREQLGRVREQLKALS